MKSQNHDSSQNIQQRPSEVQESEFEVMEHQ